MASLAAIIGFYVFTGQQQRKFAPSSCQICEALLPWRLKSSLKQDPLMSQVSKVTFSSLYYPYLD
jgi:hypothetical protein